MKIGLLTIFNVPNYGAMLQCYALSKVLTNMGHEVFLYNIPLSDTNRLAYRIKKVLKLNFMTHFQKEYLPNMTNNLSEKADIYLIGSDQVWNPDITGKVYDKYFFSFVPDDAKMISYAASFGTNKWMHPELKERISSLLARFNQITVREENGIHILNVEFGINAKWVLDPCLLLDSYADFTFSSHVNDNYIACYKLCYSKEWYHAISRFAKKKNSKLKELASPKIKGLGPLRGFNTTNQSVQEWVSTIANAKYVLTDSFHGTVFSILFKKQFYVFPGVVNRNARLSSLLSSLDLEDRYCDSFAELDSRQRFKKKIDYVIVYKKLLALREDSLNCLRNMI